MKRFSKVLVAAVFVTALFTNVSIEAYKTVKGTNLFGLISEANATCESSQSSSADAKCLSLSQECVLVIGSRECHF